MRAAEVGLATHCKFVLLLVVFAVRVRLVVDQHVGVESEVSLVEDGLLVVALLEEVAFVEGPPDVERRAAAIKWVRAGRSPQLARTAILSRG